MAPIHARAVWPLRASAGRVTDQTMSEPVSVAARDDTQHEAALIVRSHRHLPHKPQRTLEALHVFFRRDANRILVQLRAGPVEARRGDLISLGMLSRSLAAHGFDVDVVVVGHREAGADRAAPGAVAGRASWHVVGD